MPGTRTAPTFNDTPSDRMITLHLIDASGDPFSVAFHVPIATLAADIEGYAAAYQLATNASLWKITDNQAYEGEELSSNAVAAYRGGSENGINLLFKDVAGNDSVTPRVIAPVLATMSGNNDVPDVAGATLAAVISAIDVLKPTYEFNSAQYTTHRERKNNPRVSS